MEQNYPLDRMGQVKFILFVCSLPELMGLNAKKTFLSNFSEDF